MFMFVLKNARSKMFSWLSHTLVLSGLLLLLLVVVVLVVLLLLVVVVVVVVVI
jgi:hypothetical protein